MSTMVRARRDASGNVTMFFDAATHETIAYNNPATLHEDFVGPGHTSVPAAGAPSVGYPWVSKTVHTAGAVTVAPVANAPGGVVALTTDATSEKQDAAIYANDALNWDATKGLIFEARVAAHVLPSLVTTEMVFGLQSAWIDGPDNAGFYLRFQMLGSGAVSVQTKDGVRTLSIASGVTLVADAYHIFRIDCSDPTNVVFFIDGVQVNANGTLSFAATGANAVLQPYAAVYKASGTGVGTLYIDAIACAMNRT